MTLLTICTQVASKIPVAAPSSIIGNSDETAQLLLACAQDEGEALARRPQGGWVAMIQEHTFQTVATSAMSGVTTEGSPVITGLSSTSAISPNTFYCTGTNIPNNAIVQSVDSSTQVTLNVNALASGTSTNLIFSQSDYPVPSDFQRPIDNTQWDRTRFWSMRGPQDPQQWQLYKSSVIGRASIQRRYRFRQIGGSLHISIDPVPTDNGSTLVFEYVSNAWCKSATGALQTSWQADTDVGILDEYLIRLGVQWRMLRRLGLSYSEEKAEYDAMVDKAVAQDGGSAILDLSPPNHLTLIGPWNLPETNFGNVVG